MWKQHKKSTCSRPLIRFKTTFHFIYMCTTFPPPPSQLDKLSVIKIFWFSSNPELAGYKTLVKEKKTSSTLYIFCVCVSFVVTSEEEKKNVFFCCCFGSQHI